MWQRIYWPVSCVIESENAALSCFFLQKLRANGMNYMHYDDKRAPINRMSNVVWCCHFCIFPNIQVCANVMKPNHMMTSTFQEKHSIVWWPPDRCSLYGLFVCYRRKIGLAHNLRHIFSFLSLNSCSWCHIEQWYTAFMSSWHVKFMSLSTKQRLVYLT